MAADPEVRINPEPQQTKTEASSRASSSHNESSRAVKWPGDVAKKPPVQMHWPESLEWLRSNWTWPKIRPAIRCAVAGWLSCVLFVIPSVIAFMGQASFLILISAFMSPPAEAFFAVLEREVLIILMVSLGWAWGCLGIKLADLARRQHVLNVSYFEVATGEFIEAAPTVILTVFVFVGSLFMLYIRARMGPGPYFVACLFGCICIDLSLTTAVLFPYPLYAIGKAIIIPLGFHSAIAVFTSILIFPQTVSAQFTTRLNLVLRPLVESLGLHRQLLKMDTESPDFQPTTKKIVSAVQQAEANLIPLAVTGRLLQSDLIYSRYKPTDFRVLQKLVRRMAVRGNGMTIYFTLIDQTRERFPVTPAGTRPGTPGTTTPMRSRAPSMERDGTPEGSTPGGHELHESQSGSSLALHHHHHVHRRRHKHHSSLFHLSLSVPRMQRQEHAVGVFESQRYMDLENTLFKGGEGSDPRVLSECCDDLLRECKDGIVWVQSWLANVRKGRWDIWVSGRQRQADWKKRVEEAEERRDRLDRQLRLFRSESRLLVVEPYKEALEKQYLDDPPEMPSHRPLFHQYVYEYHLMRFSTQLFEMLEAIAELETKRKRNKLWTPVERLLKWRSWQLSDSHFDDEDPNTVQGLEPTWMDDLGLPNKRDPYALPPRNAFELVMSKLYSMFMSLGAGNSLYAIKAALLTIILCIPSFLRTSGGFAYENRFFWAIFMGQLTLSRFRGDTTFGLVTRLGSTFLGGIVGMVMWYISAGLGHGNPYGFAAVCGVCFPFFFYVRLYWPGPPMTIILFFVTVLLVLGYSYQDSFVQLPGNPGFGWDVFWRRFVLVSAGVTAAFIFSLLPPSTTIRRYQRTTLATTCTELGGIYCAILSYAHSQSEEEDQEIVTSLIAIRSKLNRCAVLKQNVIYEFSLRGRWPAKRYQKILELQLQLSYNLSHLLSIFEHLEPVWTRAFMKRTRFLDSDFQGDVLAVITMIATALRTGTALPQITPCPLLDRYMLKYHGLNIIHTDSEEDYGLPRTLTAETLQNEQYMMFCVGVSTAFSIMSRLDRLMIAAKEIVGEQYHIHGLGTLRGTGIPMESPTTAWHATPRSPVAHV